MLQTGPIAVQHSKHKRAVATAGRRWCGAGRTWPPPPLLPPTSSSSRKGSINRAAAGGGTVLSAPGHCRPQRPPAPTRCASLRGPQCTCPPALQAGRAGREGRQRGHRAGRPGRANRRSGRHTEQAGRQRGRQARGVLIVRRVQVWGTGPGAGPGPGWACTGSEAQGGTRLLGELCLAATAHACAAL